MNKVILVGNVGQEPEVKSVNDRKVASFSLATSDTYKNKQGEKATNTEWHNIVIWGNLCNIVEKYVKKGDRLLLEGKIAYETYEKDNEKKYFTKIVVNELKMLGIKGESSNSQSNDSNEDDTDDMPF